LPAADEDSLSAKIPPMKIEFPQQSIFSSFDHYGNLL
jgi:hypothetical protein